jgi:hypothetical protein
MRIPFPSLHPSLVPHIVCAALAFPTGAEVGAQLVTQPPSQVLILGTYHFANPGLDVVQTEVPDVLEPGKQDEIARIVESLATFRPTKVVVEHLPSDGPRLDSLYRAYRAGEHALSRNETQQLGFRLAARFDLERVHPFDHAGEFPFGPVMEYAGRNDPAFVGTVMSEIQRITDETNRRHRELTIGEILRAMNDPGEMAHGHAMYLEFARVGVGDGYLGADLLAKWYERNIRMFANLTAVIEPGDRVLVVVGSGHAPILRELVVADAGIVLADPLSYLPER